MATFKVNNTEYSSRKMDAFKQFHVARRLGPIFSTIAQAFKTANLDFKGDVFDAIEIFEPFCGALAELKDADAEYVLNACLSVCQRNNNSVWSEVMVGGHLMFSDIDMPSMLQITWNVLQDNFSSFFLGRQTPSPAVESPSK